MRVSQLYEGNSPVISMEFFPPRDETAAQKFGNTVNNLSQLNPDYMSVTFGAGGSTRNGSFQTVKEVSITHKQPTVAYIAGYGMGPDIITEVLDSYQALGIETIFVIRGDRPRDDAFTPHPESFSYASELISFIKQRYNFTIGCAGYPEGHTEAPSLEKDIENLKRKVDSGAEYVVAQYFYNNAFFFDYIEKCRAAGVTVPIIPGIMPVYTVKMTHMLAKVCGASITPKLAERLDAVDPSDKEAVLELGIEFSAEQCRELLGNGLAGLHFYTLNRSYSTGKILQILKNEKLC